MKTNDATTVIFRKFKEGDIIALFPYEIDNYHGDCMSYMHVGQHSGANYFGCIKGTKPAKKEEYQNLYNELLSIGYKPEVKQKINMRTYVKVMGIFHKKYFNI